MTNVINKFSPAALKVVLYKTIGAWSCDQCCSQGSDSYGAPCKWCDGQGIIPASVEEVRMEISMEDLRVLNRWLKNPGEVKVHLACPYCGWEGERMEDGSCANCTAS